MNPSPEHIRDKNTITINLRVHGLFVFKYAVREAVGVDANVWKGLVKEIEKDKDYGDKLKAHNAEFPKSKKIPFEVAADVIRYVYVKVFDVTPIILPRLYD